VKLKHTSTSFLLLTLALLVPTKSLRAQSCEAVRKLALPQTIVTAVTSITPKPGWTPSEGVEVNVPLCRVEGLIEQQIGFELWLPQANSWNDRLLGAGVGGSAGKFNHRDMARGVQAGYAAVSTDSGHKLTDPAWLLDRQKVENYAYRAVHLMTDAAKRIVSAYYGRPAKHSYFIGCSGGGRQALKEMQRFPEDYDGIVAGAPGPDMPALSARFLWTGLFQKNNPQGQMSDAEWQLVSDAVISKCDSNDGVNDGVVDNPLLCSFDPGTIQCNDERQTQCLTEAQVRFVRTVSSPLRDENGKAIDGGLLPGVRTRPGSVPEMAVQLFGQGVHHNKNWDPKSFSSAKDLAAVDKEMPELKAMNPNVKSFKERGGKIILYQGWMDSAVPASWSLDYYNLVLNAVGGERETQSFMRLFMVPGMSHCQGGQGTDRFGNWGSPEPIGDPEHDCLSAVVRWVEEGKVPEQIIASRVEAGKVVRTRPLCPYPQEAQYKGSGDTDDAANFECRRP
jgi:feruloyl esterase